MKKIRFGIVGTGNIAHRFAEAIKNVENAELTAVASRTAENAEKFGDEFDIPVRFASYEAMAQSDVIDAAYIAVPHSGHKPCSCLMMNNGKHVLCEKPLAVNAREAEEMFACAEKNGVLLTEAMWARLVPGTQKLIELVNSGKLGEIKGVEGKFCYTLDEDETDHHVLKPEHGGGSTLDVGVYGLNFASWYLGNGVESIKAADDDIGKVDGHTCVLIKYRNGGIAQLSSAISLRKPNEGYVYGTKGYVRLSRFYAPQKLEFHLNDGTEETIEVPYEGNGFEEQIRHFCACVSDGLIESPVVTHAQTLFIMKQMDEIRRLTDIYYPQDAPAADAVKVALFGDSIRMNYENEVRALLGRGYNVISPSDNCRFSSYMLTAMFDMDEQLNGCEVIHFNAGEWDVTPMPDGEVRIPIEVYVANVIRAAEYLKTKAKTVIFATTTPTKENHPNRNEDIIRYNEAIVPELKKRGIIINDLYTAVDAEVEKLIRGDDGIHLTEEGIKFCGEKVAKCIKAAAD